MLTALADVRQAPPRFPPPLFDDQPQPDDRPDTCALRDMPVGRLSLLLALPGLDRRIREAVEELLDALGRGLAASDVDLSLPRLVSEWESHMRRRYADDRLSLDVVTVGRALLLQLLGSRM